MTLFATVPVPTADAGSPAGRAYTPRHVWQRKDACVWASGQMLVDKLTHGRVRVGQMALRRAALGHRKTDPKDGATLAELARGIARATGLRLRYSPGWADSLTWWQLLDRLEHGGGAVLLGEYGRLPAHFTRWNPAYAARSSSGHAVYVERYDRRLGRVWLMDPLAEGAYPGEWIDVEALRRFADFSGDFVKAMATPGRRTARTAPLVDHAYRLGAPVLGGPAIAGSTVAVAVPLTIDAGFPLPAAHRLVARWDPVVDLVPSDPTRARLKVEPDTASLVRPAVPVLAVTASAAVRPDSTGFAGGLPVPVVPGHYRLTVGLVESGHRAAARTLAPVEVEVLGPFSAAWDVPTDLETTAGATFTLRLGLVNIGTLDWRAPALALDGPRPTDPPATTLLVLTWRSPDGTEKPAGSIPLALAPGERIDLRTDLTAPRLAGNWTLELDVVSTVAGRVSATGADTPEIATIVDPQGLAGEP